MEEIKKKELDLVQRMFIVFWEWKRHLMNAIKTISKDKMRMNELKQYFIDGLLKINSKIKFNGCSADLEKSSCTYFKRSITS